MNEERAFTGQIVTLEFVDGKQGTYDCGLEDCECPDHDTPARQPGTYVTVRLDEDPRIGFSRVRILIEGQQR